MKRTSFLLAAVVLMGLAGKAQCLDSLGLDDAATLSRCEAEILTSLGGSWPYSVGTQPVIAFRYGNSAKAVDKSYFFHKLVMPWLKKDDQPSLNWYVLTEAERQRTGVDAIVVAWSKVGFTDRAQRRVVRQL